MGFVQTVVTHWSQRSGAGGRGGGGWTGVLHRTGNGGRRAVVHRARVARLALNTEPRQDPGDHKTATTTPILRSTTPDTGEYPTSLSGPEASLRAGGWFKLICGASYQDVVSIRQLSRDYTLAGADCIDCSADEAVVHAVLAGVQDAVDARRRAGDPAAASAFPRPWLMVSVSDDEEPHFRKARLDVRASPLCLHCHAPCVAVCPADAITFPHRPGRSVPATPATGIIDSRCYGCGRCLSACPYDKITARTYVHSHDSVARLLREHPIDALEIHTRDATRDAFRQLWGSAVGEAARARLRLVAVSMPEPAHESVYEYVAQLLQLGTESEYGAGNASYPLLLWQCDGKPMSGDLGGRGATRATIAYAQRLAATLDRHPHWAAARGFVQCAGGTNAHTVPMLGDASGVCGVAYGGYARKVGLEGGLPAARTLVSAVKTRRVPNGMMSRSPALESADGSV
ncbi:hypothetical protein CDCA_CDCA07G2142 [Cyanidium caldarium]|uniref:4Fe-4S ferredoxin-type domain-containing protein n=1 Tax=Cyanidium caldarium TaxID=2771 RepID=A0AAV9IUV1_CYACA|nr:hypothetical protein CDCA_CDCA07G2142 [Cyanidium caldarium]